MNGPPPGKGYEIVEQDASAIEGVEWAKLERVPGALGDGAGSGGGRGRAGDARSPPADSGSGHCYQTEDADEGRDLDVAVDSVVVQETKEEGVLTRAEINEIMAGSSDPNFTLPLEAKYWSREQLQMFVLSQGLIRPKGCSIPDERLMANTNMSKDDIVRAFAQAADWISSADALLIGSGAGMGVDSGLGTFRGGRRGVWQGLEEVGLAYEDICDAKWFRDEPRLAWAFWDHCHKVYQETTPHDGYSAARTWGLKCPLGYYSFTSNIDSHWASSGVAADRILEVHGAVKWLQCSQPCCPDVWRAPKDLRLSATATHRVAGTLPTCPKCKAVARPNVQMFGGDRGFSKARRESQFSKYDAWLKQLEARPDKDNLRVVCFEVGCGVTVPTVRKELETVMRNFPQARLIRVNPENPGLAQDLVERGVSLPVAAGAAIEEIGRQMDAGEPEVTFILNGRSGGGCVLRAPYRSTLGRVLRLAAKEEGVSIDVAKNTKAIFADVVRREEIELDTPVPTSFFREMKEPGGDGVRPAAALTLDCEIRCASNPRNWNEAFAKHVDEAGRMMDEMNTMFEASEYQDEVRKCRDRRAVMRQVRAVHLQVVPKYGFAASERGTACMQTFISCVQEVPEIKWKVARSMDLSYIAHMNHLPHVSSGTNLALAVAVPEAAESALPAAGVAPTEAPREVQDTIITVGVAALAPDGDEVESGRQEITSTATIGALRAQMAQAWGWDEGTERGARFFGKDRGTLYALRDTDTVRKAVFVRGPEEAPLPPPLRMRKPAERVELALVDFESAAANDGDTKSANTFRHSTMSDITIAELRAEVAMALGWNDAERKQARFVKKLAMGFATLKEHERVEGKKTLFVRGAPLLPRPGAGAGGQAVAGTADVATTPAAGAVASAGKDARPKSNHTRHVSDPGDRNGAGYGLARRASDPTFNVAASAASKSSGKPATEGSWIVCPHHDWNGPMVDKMDASDLSRARQHAQGKGYAGFSVWNGTAYFKSPGRQLRQSDLVYKGVSDPVDFHLFVPANLAAAAKGTGARMGKGLLTVEDAVNLQRDLLAGYGAEDFQRRLGEMKRAGNKARYTSERLKLLLEVQATILPRYGFEGNLQGAMAMMEAFGAMHLQGSKEIQEYGMLLEGMIA